MAVLEMKEIFYAYEKDRPVLANVNTQFDAGKMYAILGPSGSGKTTLLSLIGGLDTPQKGEILFEGGNISQCGLAVHRRNHVSLIFQNYNLIDYMTPIENVALTAKKDVLPMLLRLGLTAGEAKRNKDARVDQKILDETFGIFGWKRSHQSIEGNLYCTVAILDKKIGEWVAKQDVGTTGYAEKEKSQASDSFKRACFNWGIGRELYTAPFIWIPAGKVSIQSKETRYICNERFSVSSIQYNDNREISGLVIVNDGGKTVYELKAKGARTAGGSKGKTADKNSDQGKAAQQIMCFSWHYSD